MLDAAKVNEIVNRYTGAKDVTLEEIQKAYQEMGEDLIDAIRTEDELTNTIQQMYGGKQMRQIVMQKFTIRDEMEQSVGHKIKPPAEEEIADSIVAYVTSKPDDLFLPEMQHALKRLGGDYLTFLCEQQCMSEAIYEQLGVNGMISLFEEIAKKQGEAVHVDIENGRASFSGEQQAAFCKLFGIIPGDNMHSSENEKNSQSGIYMLEEKEVLEKAGRIIDTPPEKLDIAEAQSAYLEIAQSLLTYIKTQNYLLSAIKEKYGEKDYEDILKRANELEKADKQAECNDITTETELTNEQIETFKKVFSAVLDDDMLYDGEKE